MRLRRISIRNFRNLRSVDLRPAKTTVILGENNAGKSNLLHALRLLFDVQAERLRLDLSEDDINDSARSAGEKWFTVTAEVGDLQKHIEVEACFKERIDQDGGETFVTIEGRYELDNEGLYSWKTVVLPPAGRYNEPIPMSPRMLRAIPLYFMDAVRDAGRDTRATGRGLFAQLLSDVDYSDVSEEVRSHLKDANTALNQGKEITELASGLTKEMTPHIPGGQAEVLIAVADEDSAHLTQSLHLHIRKAPGVNYSDISRQGTGLQNIALMAMFRHKVASETKGVPILAIEEPEAHLHPHAQRRLFKDLDSLNAPVLITTHAASIVKHAHPLSLVLLRNTQADETTAHQLDQTKVDEADLKGLAQLMRGGRADMFFARSIIVVEGETELIALPAFAELLGCDLDRDGISLVEAGGNHYAFILRACRPDQFAIPAVITYDTDALGDNNSHLKEAYKAGLINRSTCDSHSSAHPDVASERKAVLDQLKWIGVVRNFEEEICRGGYMEVVEQAIEDADSVHHSQTIALESFLKKNGLEKDASSVAAFVKSKEKLKIPVARAIADATSTVREVPACYRQAIQRANLESMGGIVVDDHVVRRACSAGFTHVILETIEVEGATEAMKQFMISEHLNEDAVGLHTFLTKSDAGERVREKAILAVADAVELIGCKKYAQAIRISMSASSKA